jgi:hypothetical protein
MTAVTFLSLSALRAQQSAAVALPDSPSVDMDSGTDGSLVPGGPAVPSEIAPPTTPDEADSLDNNLYGRDQAMSDAPPEPDAQSRPWKLNLHASTGSFYDDNILISSTARHGDFITRLTAGGGITLGDYTVRQNNYLISDYTGIADLFGHYTNRDAYEQLASLEGQLLFGHLTIRGDFTLQDLADEDIDIGTRARRQIYIGRASARYDISDKTFLLATAQITVAHYDLYLGSNDERGGISFNYLPDPSVTVGLGVLGGVLNVQDASSQTYEQLLATLQVETTAKFTLKASGGIEDRQTPTNNGLITPILDITGDYKPYDGLDLTLTAYRQVENSAFYAGSDFISTGVSAGVQYELSPRFTLLLEAGYANSDYRAVAASGNVSRDDDYFFTRPAFRYVASPYCNLELYYFYRDNESTLDASNFNDTQVGATVNLAY